MSRPLTPAWRIPAFPNSSLERREEFEAAASRAGAPRHFYCPMSHRILLDPVTLSNGQTFERRYIERWIELGQTTCPFSGEELPPPVSYTSNPALQQEIEAWCNEHIQLPAVAPDAEATVTPFSVEHKDEINQNFVADDFVVAMAIQEDELDSYTSKSHLPRIRTRNHSTPSAPSVHSASIHSGLDTPERNSRSGLKLAAFRLSVAAAYVTLYILALWKGDWKLEDIHLNPLVGPNRPALSSMGSLVNQKVQEHNQWWRIPSSLFLSAGVIQLFCSLICLLAVAHHLEKSSRLWRPHLTVPVIFLVSGLTGAVTAVSLAYDQDSTGASAGICGLLGAAWMEQFTCLRRERGRFITLIVLVLLTAVFAILSLLPMVGMWYSATALLCGALLLPMALLPPRAENGKGRQVFFWVLRLLCLGLVLAILVLGILSVVLDESESAQECPFCKAANCVEIRSWWQCELTSSTSASACQFEQNRNGTTTITCPIGSSRLWTDGRITDQAAACNQACAVTNMFGPSSAAPSSAGVLI